MNNTTAQRPGTLYPESDAQTKLAEGYMAHPSAVKTNWLVARFSTRMGRLPTGWHRLPT